MVAFTLARLLLVWGLVGSYGISPWVSVAWLTAIVLVDLFDGMIARSFGADGTLRRVADVVVDYVSIVWALVAMLAAKQQYVTWVIVAFLCAATLFKLLYATAGARAYFTCRVLMRGKGLHHKMVPFAFVLLCLAMLFNAPNAVVNNAAGLVMLMCNITGVSFWLTYRRVIRVKYAENTTVKVVEATGLPAYDFHNPDLML